MHEERIHTGTGERRLHSDNVMRFPTGTFVLLDDGPAMIELSLVSSWTPPRGYVRPPRKKPTLGTARVLTPPSTVEALRNGYRPETDIVVLFSYDDGRPSGF